MPRVYRRFSREFKMQIVAAVLQGAAVSIVAKANDLHPELVRKWVRDFRQYQKDAFAGRGRAYTDDAKIAQLERQLGQVAAENIALKKSLAAHQRVSARERRVALVALARELSLTPIATEFGSVQLSRSRLKDLETRGPRRCRLHGRQRSRVCCRAIRETL